VDPRACLLRKDTIIRSRAVRTVGVREYRHEIGLLEADGEQYVSAARTPIAGARGASTGCCRKLREKTRIDRMAPRID
jgi:hypothetical protein